jgi:hypothetical protein
MQVTENQFNMAFHRKQAWKCNVLHYTFKSLIIVVPIIIFFFFNLWVIIGITIADLFLYVLSVKMRSLRNVNMFAVEEFKRRHQLELNRIFK